MIGGMRKVKSFSSLQKTNSFEHVRSLKLYSKIKRSKSFEKNQCQMKKNKSFSKNNYVVNEEKYPLSFSYMIPTIFTKSERLQRIQRFFSKTRDKKN